MDVSFAIRQRLDELGLEQRELARAARVTESYVSQLLRRKKHPPDPGRTDIYEKMDKFLKGSRTRAMLNPAPRFMAPCRSRSCAETATSVSRMMRKTIICFVYAASP